METKCSNCDEIIESPNIKFSCSHFLCGKCLSQKLLLQKFKPLTSSGSIEINCLCNGKAKLPFKVCLDNISKPEILKKSKKGKSSSKCFYHNDYNTNIFCKNCNKLICKKCETDESNPENNHSGHWTISIEEYNNTIKNMKKSLKFKTYEECIKFIDKKEDEITNDFSKKCEQSKKTIDKAIEVFNDIKNNYIKKYEEQKRNLKNIFLIIKQVYNNFYSQLEQQNNKIDISLFELISKINFHFTNIIYKANNFDKFEEISSTLDKINKNHYYDIKFNFSKMKYEKSDFIDLEEGVTVLCPLKSVKNSFACGTEKGKIKIYTKNSEDNEYAENGAWEWDDSSKTEGITSLIELKKIENILIAASSDKKLRVFTITNNDNKCKINFKKDYVNYGIVLDIFELNDGRISFSTSDKTIKIWNLNEEYNYNKIIEIKNKDVGFEKCLSEIQILENDENNKQLVSGGRGGVLKRWDINSGKLEKRKIFKDIKLLTCITIIDNHKLAIGTEEGFILIYDHFASDTNLKVKIISGHTNCINAMYYLNSNQTLFSCSKDFTIKVWDLESSKCTNTLRKQHSKNIYDIIVCGKDLISCSNDHCVNIYSNEENADEEENYDDFNN